MIHRHLRNAALSLLLLAAPAFGYGEEGHQAIGAIADGLLKGKPAAAKLSAMLEGIPLQKAGLIADQIKAWDRNESFTLGPEHKTLEAALRAFWEATSEKGDNGDQIHRAFHYTDAAISPTKPTYVEGTVGTRRDDLVHITAYCISVLDGTIPEKNDVNITKPVAAVLLAHYIGDLHQPLHVGAAYFSEVGLPIAPEKGNTFYDSRGGNNIDLSIAGKSVGNLHSYWDTTVVLEALQLKDGRFDVASVQPLITKEPATWKPAANSKPIEWPKTWADDILPLAKQAHDRLTFDVTTGKDKKFKARVVDAPGEKPYPQWAADAAKAHMQKAGWRLAFLFEQLLR